MAQIYSLNYMQVILEVLPMHGRADRGRNIRRFTLSDAWYNIPLFSLIQMLKFVVYVLNLK